jgi:hypothetical protein
MKWLVKWWQNFVASEHKGASEKTSGHEGLWHIRVIARNADFRFCSNPAAATLVGLDPQGTTFDCILKFDEECALPRGVFSRGDILIISTRKD